MAGFEAGGGWGHDLIYSSLSLSTYTTPLFGFLLDVVGC